MKNIFLILIYLLYNAICQNNTYSRVDNSNNEPEQNSGIDAGFFHLTLMNPIFKPFLAEWEKTMSTFSSQYIYYVPIKYRSHAEYYENITKVPCLFQGAFLYDEAKSERDIIEFKIIAPNSSVIYRKTFIGAIFSLNLIHKGLYTISFNNKYITREVRPILMVNSGQNLIIGKDNLSETEKKLDTIITFLGKYQQDINLMRKFKRKGKEYLSTTNSYFYAFSLIETIILIIVSLWQYYYLKHLFEIKGSL